MMQFSRYLGERGGGLTSMQCNVESSCQLSICSGTEETIEMAGRRTFRMQTDF
jgi:hypothetical protein